MSVSLLSNKCGRQRKQVASTVCLPYCSPIILRWNGLYSGNSSCGWKELVVDLMEGQSYNWWERKRYGNYKGSTLWPGLNLLIVCVYTWTQKHTCTHINTRCTQMQAYTYTNAHMYIQTHYKHTHTTVLTWGGVLLQQQKHFPFIWYTIKMWSEKYAIIMNLTFKIFLGAKHLAIQDTGTILWPVISDYYKTINIIRPIYSK